MSKFKRNQRVRIAKKLAYGTVIDLFDDGDNSKYTLQLETRQAEYTQSELRYTYYQLLSQLIHFLFLSEGYPGRVRAAYSWYASGVIAGALSLYLLLN